jgi:hypothetical protein
MRPGSREILSREGSCFAIQTQLLTQPSKHRAVQWGLTELTEGPPRSLLPAEPPIHVTDGPAAIRNPTGEYPWPIPVHVSLGG